MLRWRGAALSGWRQVAGCGVGLSDRLPDSRDARYLLPGPEGDIARSTMPEGSQAMTAELEVIVDPAVDGEEASCVPR